MPQMMSDDDMMDSYSNKSSEEPTPSVDQENAEAGEETAVVSNKLLSPAGSPLKEGDEIVVRVVKNYGDESEIALVSKGEDDETETESTPEEDFAAMDMEKG